MQKLLLALALACASSLAFAQGAVLQGGPWSAGHLPQYVGQGAPGGQAVLSDGGAAAGGAIGANVGEIGVVARGTGTAPYAGQGTGPYGTNVCDYDAPTTNATGYHFLCFSANAQGGGLLAYGAGGVATPGNFNFIVNGVTYAFPFTGTGGGNVVGPGTSTVNDIATFNSSAGTLLKDSGISLGSQSQNLVLATPSGSSGAPAFRALTLVDIPITGTPLAGYVPIGTGSTAAWTNLFGGANPWTGLQTFNGGINTISGTIGNTNSVWTNAGAHVVRLSDRLFVGAAAIVNGGNVPESPQDWLDALGGGTQNSQAVVLSTLGLTGAAFGSRASDWPGPGVANDAVGVAFYGISDNTDNTAGHGAWGGYGECQRLVGINQGCLGLEIDAANYGVVVDIQPYAMFPTAGPTVALWNGCGGVNRGTAPCSAVLTALSNTQKFRKGFVFEAAALDTSVGNSGNGVWAELALGQEMRWLDTGGNLAAEIYATKPSSQAFLNLNVPTNGGYQLAINGVNQVALQTGLMFPSANNTYSLGDDTVPLAWKGVVSNGFEAIGTAPTVTSGRVGIGGGTSTGGTCPSGTVGGQTVVGCWTINIGGTNRNVPYF